MTQIIVYHGKKGFINRFVRRICKDTETHVAFLHEDESVSGARPKGASFHGGKDSGLIAPCDFADDLHRIRLIRTVRIKNYKSN